MAVVLASDNARYVAGSIMTVDGGSELGDGSADSILAHLVVDRLQGRDRSAGCLQFRRPSAPGHVCWFERCGRRYPFGRRTRELRRFSFPSPPALGLDRQLIEVDPAA
ncbi:hypothetical protein [Phenylobacterium sp. 58.2.17]|uniref:hypothetical protein n=1 Tax=Phenylobacterium sp. 58.2.17 TaxID=2969306 RepID=UPI0022646ED0|nr:hypothetical protein [Phenylobacterium sp. 58.2.17]MCX7584764.1 hypothetical protein [Phenylobacterium sp. 58.2.17]